MKLTLQRNLPSGRLSEWPQARGTVRGSDGGVEGRKTDLVSAAVRVQGAAAAHLPHTLLFCWRKRGPRHGPRPPGPPRNKAQGRGQPPGPGIRRVLDPNLSLRLCLLPDAGPGSPPRPRARLRLPAGLRPRPRPQPQPGLRARACGVRAGCLWPRLVGCARAGLRATRRPG